MIAEEDIGQVEHANDKRKHAQHDGTYVQLQVLHNNSLSFFIRQGSNALDSSSATARSSPVILSAAKDLAAARDRPFAALRVTRSDCSNGQVQFVQIEPCLKDQTWQEVSRILCYPTGGKSTGDKREESVLIFVYLFVRKHRRREGEF